MAQNQNNNVTRFAGPDMIQDFHHMAGIPQVDDNQNDRQSQQGQSKDRQTNSREQGSQFEYHNPRQYS